MLDDEKRFTTSLSWNFFLNWKSCAAVMSRLKVFNFEFCQQNNLQIHLNELRKLPEAFSNYRWALRKMREKLEISLYPENFPESSLSKFSKFSLLKLFSVHDVNSSIWSCEKYENMRDLFFSIQSSRMQIHINVSRRKVSLNWVIPPTPLICWNF